MKKLNRSSKKTRSSLRVEALEQRQLLAGITGGGTEVLSNINHQNGNVYDQVLMTGASVSVTADAGQITRVSFLDLSGDIVQVEFSGKGSLTVSLDGAKTEVAPSLYNQTGVKYVQGLASFTITGADASTNFNVFSVGSGNAVNSALFTDTLKGGNHFADVQRLTIVADPANANGSTFGGITAGNAVFGGSTGVVGISAANVQVQNVVRIGDLDASGTATPTLVFGANSQFGSVYVAGGDLAQTNAAPINNTGSYKFGVQLVAGGDSAGTALPAKSSSGASGFTGSNPFEAQTTSYTLTSGIDNIAGTANSDTVTGVVDVVGSTTTLTALDVIKGGAGSDTLNINIIQDKTSTGVIPSGLTISDIETVVVRSSGNATVDSTAWSGVTGLKVTQAVDVTATAGDSTAVEIAGVTGAIVVDGGSSVAVTATGSGQAVTIGGTTAPSGAITLTHQKLGAGTVDVDGGSTVTVTATGFTTGAINVGQNEVSSGAVTVSATGPAYAKGDGSSTLGAITIDGGTNVTVTQAATASASAIGTDTGGKYTITQGAVAITATDSSTTSVTVTQSAPVAAKQAVTGIAGALETQKVSFVALAAGETATVNGLTFVAVKALTAAEVAAAFANISNGATIGSAPVTQGSYSGTFNSGGVQGATGAVTTENDVSSVTFTSKDRADVGLVPVSDTAAAGDVTRATIADGAAKTDAVTGVLGIAGGAVTIDGRITGADVLSSVTLTGFGVGSTIKSDALTSLSLSNSSEDLVITNTVATTMGLTLNTVGSSSNTAQLTLPTYTTLNVSATGGSSAVELTAAAVKTLTVSGDKSVNLTAGAGSTLSALETVTVTGSAGLTINASGATVKSVDTTSTTGTVTATIDASKATYTGGAGVDAVTLSATTVSKSVNTGAGNDSVKLASGTASLSEIIVAGDGTDTLIMTPSDAASVSVNDTFESKIDGFEKLSLTNLAAGSTATVNLANLDDISYVVSANTSETKEVFTADFSTSAAIVGADTIVFNGTTITLATADTPATIATKVAAGSYADWTTSVAGNVVTFTAKVSGNVADVVAGNFAITDAGNDGTTAAVAVAKSNDGAAPASLTIDKLANSGTLELTAAGTGVTVGMADATGSSDVLNLVLTTTSSSINVGTVTAAGVETINITATDTDTSSNGGGTNTETVTLKDAALKTVNVTGSAHLSLALDANVTALTSVDASALTGNLTASTNGTVAQTITGGAGADTLTAKGDGDILVGGAGNDTLKLSAGADLVSLTGGAGSDTFDVGFTTVNVNSYATITDLGSGDLIKFANTAATESFASAKITLGDTAVFQDYANAAINNSSDGAVSWFQFGGNTYIVQNGNGAGTSFANGTDYIVKLSGLVDLSASSFSASTQTLRYTPTP